MAVNEEMKKILEALNNQIDSKELAAAIKADNFEGEYKLSDDAIEGIVNQTTQLLSIEGAKHNQEIGEYYAKDLYPKHKKSATSFIEEKLKPILDKLGFDYSNYEYLSDALNDLEPVIDKVLVGGKSDDLVNALKKDLEEAKSSLELKDEEWGKTLQEKEEAFRSESLKKQYFIEANEFKLAEAYSDPDLKEAILEKKWSKINASSTPKLGEDGRIRLYQKDIPDKELYDGNKQVVFQNMLEQELEPYIKKSNPVPTGQPAPVEGKTLSPQEEAARANYLAQQEVYRDSAR